MLSVKAQEFVDRWTGKSIDFEAYKSGVNPFVLSGNKFASVAMQFLMDRGSCTKMELTDYLIEHAGARGHWGMGTAGSHAGIVFDAFEHLGIITILEGKAHLVSNNGQNLLGFSDPLLAR
ncbi:recombinase [Xanthomonas phage JGB6]|nr:recombinase [Xanthomonas phage JGB6]